MIRCWQGKTCTLQLVAHLLAPLHVIIQIFIISVVGILQTFAPQRQDTCNILIQEQLPPCNVLQHCLVFAWGAKKASLAKFDRYLLGMALFRNTIATKRTVSTLVEYLSLHNSEQIISEIQDKERWVTE